MVDIILVRSNSVIYDPRVHKIARSLSKKYSVIVLGWNRDKISEQEIDQYFVKLRLFNLKTSIWKPSLKRIITRLLLFAPIFWTWVFIQLVVDRPKVLHACDLDTVLPCYIYKILFRKKLVFDVFDRYAMAFIPKNYRRLYAIINNIEELFSKHSDVLVVAGGEKVLNTFHTKSKKTYVIMNCSIESQNVVSTRGKRREYNELTLIYTGLIRHNRSLDSVAAAIDNMAGVQFIIAGAIYDTDLHRQLMKKSNIKYQGLLKHTDVLDLEASCDVMIALYELRDPQNIFVVPNKVLESMMCGIPVISNAAQDLIQEIDCGIIVEYGNVAKIREAVMKLRDNQELRKTLGNNGRQAFLEKYNWTKMEQKLYEIYDPFLMK